MNAWSYTRGLHDLGNSVYAYLQPDGGMIAETAADEETAAVAVGEDTDA